MIVSFLRAVVVVVVIAISSFDELSTNQLHEFEPQPSVLYEV